MCEKRARVGDRDPIATIARMSPTSRHSVLPNVFIQIGRHSARDSASAENVLVVLVFVPWT